MKLLAVDPGTLHCGYSLFSPNGPFAWGVVETAGAAYEERLLIIRGELEQLVTDHQVTDVCWERVPPAARGYDTNALLLRALDVALRRWVVAWKTAWARYLPNVVRAGVIGGGFRFLEGDVKDQVRAAVLLRWPRAGLPSDLPSHVYDAVAVGDHHLAQLRLLGMITDPFERACHLARMQGKRAR